MSVTSDEPREEFTGGLHARRESSGPIRRPNGHKSEADGADDALTGIIRRHPSGPIPQPLSDDTRTSIIKRAPSDSSAISSAISSGISSGSRTARQAPPRRVGAAPASEPTPSAATALAAATFNILNGWGTAVIATGLINGWWKTDRLFCVGVGFLTAVCGASIITGVFQLLLRRRVGIYLTLVGAVLAVLIFAGIFVTGAHVSGVVRALPVLPAAAAFMALLPATWRWTRR